MYTILDLPCTEFVKFDEERRKSVIHEATNQEKTFQILTKMVEYNGAIRPRF
jgi:glutathione peroxidase-family protein